MERSIYVDSQIIWKENYKSLLKYMKRRINIWKEKSSIETKYM